MDVLDLMRDSASELPVPAQPEGVTALRVWHCKYRTLEPLGRFQNLETLVVATWPDSTLDVLAGLDSLTYLSLHHLPKVTDLAPLAHLQNLTTLCLHTLPSWDSSGKKTVVRSLEPLALLPSLHHLELFGVVPEDGSLRALEAASGLESVRVHKYARRERDRFYEATGVSDAFAPGPPVTAW